jgi:hypothetical protein
MTRLSLLEGKCYYDVALLHLHNVCLISDGFMQCTMLLPYDYHHDRGIHGACIAYYLMKQGVRCTIIEEVAIAAAASGVLGSILASLPSRTQTNTNSILILSLQVKQEGS